MTNTINEGIAGMSEERFQDLERLLSRLSNGIIGLLAGAFMLGIWVTTIEFRTRNISEEQAKDSSDNRELMNWKSEMSANRFTFQDYVRSSAPISESLSNNDKRIQRVEDAISQINKSLDRIEGKLGTK